MGGGEAYCFSRMTLHIPIVLEQKTIVFQNIGVTEDRKEGKI